MAVEIKVPAVGESVTEGILARWYKNDGDTVQAEEPLLELETDKATSEVSAPAAGVLHITVREGQTVTVGSVVGQIDERAPAAQANAAKERRPAEAKTAATSSKEPARAPQANAAPEHQPAPAKAEVPLSPSARLLADDKGIDVRQVRGTGPRGRVTKEDVMNFVDRSRPALIEPKPSAAKKPHDQKEPEKPSAQTAGGERRERMSTIRQRIAERLVAAQHTAAILTTFNEADMTAVLALRSKYKDSFKEKHGVGLGFMSFFVKACVEALRANPAVNARIDGSEIVYHDYCHIGVAVSTDRGLMVPVVRDADRLSFAAIEQRVAELAVKARDGQITVNDLQGGTFTITNGGVFGSLLSTPILNPPQSGILGMHTIQKRPIAIADQVVIRPMMYLALSYDHRLVDGRDAVRFFVRVKECVESPERLLLEV